MSGIVPKKRPISRYLKDYKHSQTHCSQCKKLLDRMVLVLCGKIINKEAIARMAQPIDDHAWLGVQNKLTALCRFCSEVSCNSQSCYFNIMAFKQYLFEQTEMSHSTIREYVVRLRRLDEMLAAQHYPTDSFTDGICHQRLVDDMPAAAHDNYRIALRKYNQYLAWQQDCLVSLI